MLAGAGALTIPGCATGTLPGPGPMAGTGQASRFLRPTLVPLLTDPQRISHITVCTRPFRPEGPRIEAEAFGDKRLVHNYGHGGSGWSLSWGSAVLARDLALSGGPDAIAVIGCGALGLTTALTILRSGVPVSIYAAERTPHTRSARATGIWSPDSRIAAEDQAAPGFPALWEAMARVSWAEHLTRIGLDGEPVKFIDQYNLYDRPARSAIGPQAAPGRVNFAHYADRIEDLGPGSRRLSGQENPFPVASASRFPQMTFNVAEYARQLTEAFLMEGGRMVQRTFHTPADLLTLHEPVVVNCTGYGARALFGDDSLVPVRGQIGWLVPQPEVNYGLYYRRITMVPRADGIVIQANGAGGMVGYGIEDETPDPAETHEALRVLSGLFAAA